MSSDIYSPFKIAHHQDKLEELRQGKQPVPLQIQLVISDLCNHNCSFCAYRMEGYTSNQNFGVWDEKKQVRNNNPNRQISLVKGLEILDDCKRLGVKAIQFTGGGEPTVHPHHEDLMQRTLDHKMDLALVTNGFRVSDRLIEIITQGAWLRISLDAGTKETYSKVREVPITGFERTLKNIARIVEAKKKNNSKLVFGIGFVVDSNNYSELYQATKLCSELGVDNIRLSASFTQDDESYHAKHYALAKAEAIKAVEDFSRPDFKVFNMFGERIDDLKQHAPNYGFCGYMHLNTYIGADLKVYTCCNNAYSDKGEMGNLTNQSFFDYWLSESKKEKFKAFNPKKCDRCMFNNKNRFINYLLEKNPGHVNYV